MSVGLEALRIFKAKGTVGMREKYPIIYRDDIDKECEYNPNVGYLYSLSSENVNNEKSGFNSKNGGQKTSSKYATMGRK